MNDKLASEIKKLPLQRGLPSKIILTGQHSYGVEGIQLRSWREGANCYIGGFCSIAKFCTIYLGGMHLTDCATTYPFGFINQDIFPKGSDRHPATKGHVIIHNDVWIGENATLLSGIEVHNGAVIANGSIVTKDVPPYTIVGGNPAKPIKTRFSSEVISALTGRPESQSVVVTGRGGGQALREAMDTVSEVKEIKHAYRAGIRARQGVDY